MPGESTIRSSIRASQISSCGENDDGEEGEVLFKGKCKPSSCRYYYIAIELFV